MTIQLVSEGLLGHDSHTYSCWLPSSKYKTKTLFDTNGGVRHFVGAIEISYPGNGFHGT